MTQRSCCVPGCSMKRGEGSLMHRFPNPEKQLERFRSWTKNIGGDNIGEDDEFIYKNWKVCHRHFADVYVLPNSKITPLSVPTLGLPGVPSTTVQTTTASSTFRVPINTGASPREIKLRKRVRNLRATPASSTRRRSSPASAVPGSEKGLLFRPTSITQSTNDNDCSPSPSLRNTKDSSKSDQPRVSPAMSTSKRRKKSLNGKILEIEPPKLNFLQETATPGLITDADNEHLLFFKSLLPQVNKIPQQMLPSFKNSIKSVVEEFAYRSLPYDNPSSLMANYSDLRHVFPSTSEETYDEIIVVQPSRENVAEINISNRVATEEFILDPTRY